MGFLVRTKTQLYANGRLALLLLLECLKGIMIQIPYLVV